MNDEINPYASPQVPAVDTHVPLEAGVPVGRFSSTQTICTVVVVLLALNVVADVVAIGSSLWEIQLLSGWAAEESFDQNVAVANDMRQAAVGIAQLVVLLVTAICFLVWMYRSHKNLPALAAKKVKYSPGWAVGSWFIPILNLFRPYQIMQEIWRGSDPAKLGSVLDNTGGGSSLVSCWWALWIIGNFVGQASFRLAMRAESIDELIIGDWLDITSSVVAILTAIPAILIVKKITANQHQRHAALTAKT